jgi:hypothetical protein
VVAGSRNADVALMPSRSTEKRGRDFIIKLSTSLPASPDAQDSVLSTSSANYVMV